MEDRYLYKAKTAKIVSAYNNAEDGVWVKGYLRCDTGKWTIYQFEFDRADYVFYEIDPDTICQCTGLKDKNNNLIWENDILVGYLDDNYPQNATYEMVLWNKSGFCTKEQGSNDILEFCEFDQKYFEVCGNIFDNPELFESEAIKELQENIDLPFGSNVSKEAAKMAIQALEKQIPKKPTYEGDGYAPDGTFIYDTWICPCCDKRYEVDYDDYDYCPNCGQKIDWSNEE